MGLGFLMRWRVTFCFKVSDAMAGCVYSVYSVYSNYGAIAKIYSVYSVYSVFIVLTINGTINL